ncbi:unnamed protein product [Rodentolepis nana]|uniref:Transport and Golgi organization protein 1 n=1 Tax=Rodentolepis nana TaxID=102285 RepID=A0A0R3T816_RODNA|nr:unnamed protein product [Rodentolepis nana]
MLNRYHLLFLFACLVSSVHCEDPPPEKLVEMNCFDATCETPFLRGELIVDLPQFSLSKGARAEVIAQSPDFYRIKVGDATYDIPISVLNIDTHIHEGRELWRAQLSLINPDFIFSVSSSESAQRKESPANLNLDSTGKEVPTSHYHPSKKDKKDNSSGSKESLSSTSPSPSMEQRMPTSSDNETTLDNKDPQEILSHPPVKPLMEQSHKVEIKVTPPPEIKQSEGNSGIKMQPKSKKQNNDKPSAESGSETELKFTPASTIKTMEQPQDKVKKRNQDEQLHATKITPKVTSAPGIKAVNQEPLPEKPNLEVTKVGEIEKQPSVETAPNLEKTAQIKDLPGVVEVQAQNIKAVDPNIESIVKMEESDIAHTSISDGAQQHVSVESVMKTDEKAPSKVEEAKTLDISEIDPASHVKTFSKIEEMEVTSVPTFQQPPDQPYDQAPPKEGGFKEFPIPKDDSVPELPNQNFSASKLLPKPKESSKSPPESEGTVQPPVENTINQPEIHNTIAQVQLSDELEMFRDELLPTSPLLDIAKESIFFHCLSLAANGTFNGERSFVAAITLSIARRYFNAAQTLLGKLPHGLVSPLHSLFTFTFKTPLVFFISWTLFITSVVVTYLVIKLANKLLLFGFSSTNVDDPTQRSLSQWLAIEENANLLADSLADKEEAYGRLIVWSTKVSERYENQNRHAATSSTHVHNQLRDAKAALAESLKENKELKDTHDALVEQLSTVKSEATFNTAHLRDEINTLNKRLEECTRQYGESIAEKERLNDEIVSTLRDEKAVLVREVKSYQSQVESAEKTISELKEANQRFEEDLAIRDRELLSVKEAFMEIKVAELRNKSKKTVASPITPKNKTSENRTSVDGWEVEDPDLDDIIVEVEGGQQREKEELNDSDLQSAFDSLKEVGRLKVALEEAEKLAHNAASAKDQETKLRVELEEKVDSLESEIEEMRQKLRTATEKFEASETKLEVLSDYFHKREAERQKDLGRKELSQSEMCEEIALLREKLQASEVEVNTLREQLSSARRELAETERSNRRHVSELDKRLHENRLASRSLENQVKDLRTENGMLRQKIFVGDRLGVFPPGILPPPPPPPPPPQVLSLATSKLPENRSISRQLEKSPPHLSQVNLQQQLPPPFLPFPLAGPGGSQFIPPPPPPLGMISPSLLNSQINPNRSVQRPGSTTSGSNRSGKQPH